MIKKSGLLAIKNILSIIGVSIILVLCVLVIAIFFDTASFSAVISRLIAIRISSVVILAFVLINFLLIINFLYSAYRQNKIAYENLEKGKELDAAKNEFIALVSHQLRTPLSAVNWYTEALMGGDLGVLNPQQNEYMQRIVQSNQRMISLVNSILNVSKIEMNTFIIDLKPTDVVKLADDVVHEIIHQAEIKKITFQKKYGVDLTSVVVDERYVRMIIDNLLSNAIKYTPAQGNINLEIVHDVNTLRIIVKDNGYGIPKDEKDKVFSKLFRGHNILDKETDGTGLGLYIVESVVKYANGKVWFESEENKGTTFFVELPVGVVH